MTYISACAAFMLHTVCLTSHCYRDQALLRLSVAVVVLWCVLPCVCVFHCCCCLMVLWSVHMAVVRSWCEGAGGPASGFKFLLGRFVPVYCGAKAGFCGKYPAAAQPAAALKTGVRIPLSRRAEGEYEEEMRFRSRKVAPVVERAAAGVWWRMPFCCTLRYK